MSSDIKPIKKNCIILCLKDRTKEDPATYVQPTRKRFTYREAKHRIEAIAKSRNPVIVKVPYVEVNDEGYPVYVE